MGCFRRLKRFLVELNLFETSDTNERTLYVQRWSTRIYICVLLLSMSILLAQHGLTVKIKLHEVNNLSLDSYYKLQKLHPDINCPCSEISAPYGSFLTLTPIYHPICSSGFISQRWIEMLVDDMTAFHFPGDFRATASTQFQVLRELCRFSEATFNNSIQSLLKREFISSAVLSEDRWSHEIQIEIDSVRDTTLINVQHRILFTGSFITSSLLGSGIQTTISLLLQGVDDVAYIDLFRNRFPALYNEYECSCDDGDICYFPSSFYNANKVDNIGHITDGYAPSELLSGVKNWFTGCSPLRSVLHSSFNDSFISNQAALNEIATLLNFSSQSNMPTSLNLTESNLMTNGGTGIFNDLLDTSFLLNTVITHNYPNYFKQCRPASCFYSVRQYSSFLYIFTSLLSLYGGISVVLRFIIPYLVTNWVKRFKRRFRTPVVTGMFV